MPKKKTTIPPEEDLEQTTQAAIQEENEQPEASDPQQAEAELPLGDAGAATEMDADTNADVPVPVDTGQAGGSDETNAAPQAPSAENDLSSPNMEPSQPPGDMTPEILEIDMDTPPVLPAEPMQGDDADPALDDELEEEPVLAEEPSEPVKSDRQRFFELDFHGLDRGLTPEEQQEWNSIYASYRGRSALTGVITGVDPHSIIVYNPKTDDTEKQTMYCAIVVLHRVRIVIPATEMWDEEQRRPDFVLQNMVGCRISFIITKVDREAGFAIASRKRASRVRRLYFSRRPALNRIGGRIQCQVLAVGPRRCLVECYGHDLNLTQRELRYTAVPDLRTEYHSGQMLDCIVKAYHAETGELSISVKETEANPFDGAEFRHPIGCRRQAIISGKYGGGVFCNLPDGVVVMCNYSYQFEDADFMAGDSVILVVLHYDMEKRQIYGKILTKW